MTVTWWLRPPGSSAVTLSSGKPPGPCTVSVTEQREKIHGHTRCFRKFLTIEFKAGVLLVQKKAQYKIVLHNTWKMPIVKKADFLKIVHQNKVRLLIPLFHEFLEVAF